VPAAELHSVVVPVFREADGIAEFHHRLSAALSTLPDYEIIFVEDHSPDETFEALVEIAERDPHVRVLRLSRRYGHQLSLTAGVDFATGDTVTVMDGDLQHPPELVPQMIEEWRQGAEVVFAIKHLTDSDSAGKRLTSRAFYRTMKALSDTDIPAQAQDFRLMSRRATDAIRAMREQHRYLRGMAGWIGFRRAFLTYEAAPRAAGETKYSVPRMVRLAADGIFSFSTRPLTIATWVGMILAAAGLLYALVLVFLWLTGQRDVPGWTSLFVALLVFSGIQLVTLGILGEYVGRIYEEVRARPLYLVEDALGFAPEVRQRLEGGLPGDAVQPQMITMGKGR
jgi:polyisoprenyl-phosphate glycosyltransferase